QLRIILLTEYDIARGRRTDQAEHARDRVPDVHAYRRINPGANSTRPHHLIGIGEEGIDAFLTDTLVILRRPGVGHHNHRTRDALGRADQRDVTRVQPRAQGHQHHRFSGPAQGATEHPDVVHTVTNPTLAVFETHRSSFWIAHNSISCAREISACRRARSRNSRCLPGSATDSY